MAGWASAVGPKTTMRRLTVVRDLDDRALVDWSPVATLQKSRIAVRLYWTSISGAPRLTGKSRHPCSLSKHAGAGAGDATTLPLSGPAGTEPFEEGGLASSTTAAACDLARRGGVT